MSFNNALKKELQTLAEAQLALELNNWKKGDSVQRDPLGCTNAWGTAYLKDGKTFYLNITSATKALQMLNRVF
jgi:hypothetical protein